MDHRVSLTQPLGILLSATCSVLIFRVLRCPLSGGNRFPCTILGVHLHTHACTLELKITACVSENFQRGNAKVVTLF